MGIELNTEQLYAVMVWSPGIILPPNSAMKSLVPQVLEKPRW